MSLARIHPPKSSLLRGALVGAAGVLLLTLFKLAVPDALYRSTPFLLLFVPVFLAAWFGGFDAGLLILTLCAALGYRDLAGTGGEVAGGQLAIHVGVFALEALAIAWLTARLARERTRALAHARAAEEASAKLEVVLRGMTDGITLQDHTGALVYANEAAARIVGFPSASEFLAAPLPEVMSRFELFDASGAPLPLARLPNRAIFAGGTPEETLVQFRVRGTNELHWSVVNANAIYGADGRLGFVVNVFRDVSERQRQEAALRISREWFSTALRSIGDAVIATDAEGRVTFMNPVASALSGWTLEQALGKPLPEVFAIIHEGTRHKVEDPVQRVLRDGNVVGLANHTLLVRRDGSEIAIDDSAAPIRTDSGELAGVVLVFRDVSSERRHAERREFLARATIELNASLDYATTLATVARLAVPRIADWCAVDIVEDGDIRRLAVAHIDPSKVEHVAELQRRYPADPDAPRGVHHILRTGQSELMPRIPEELLRAAAQDAEHLRLIRELQLYSYIGVPLLRSGQTFGVITLVIAESKREYGADDLTLAQELAARAALAVENARLFRSAELARAEAVQANRAKDDFLAMLGHELRNPLAPIVTALELMKRRAGDTERERAVIERQVKHVVRLVDDLLDVHRIVRGRVVLAKERVDMADVVQKALELASPLFEERHHRLHVSVPEGLVWRGDSVRLTQVLTNLLTNAAKYTEPNGHVWLDVSVERDTMILRVRDDGIGIAPEMLSVIFDLFVQAPQAIDRAQGGLGLGLTIVQSLVRLFGGTVSAHSAGPDQGSEFVVRLPNNIMDVAEPSASERPPAPPGRTGTRVLVVDDNADALEMLVEALRMLGYEPHPATDADSALRVAKEIRPNLALLDIGLPVIDGYELGRRLKSLPGLEQIKLVAVTGYGQASDRERSHAAGFVAHLVKPVELRTINNLISELT